MHGEIEKNRITQLTIFKGTCIKVYYLTMYNKNIKYINIHVVSLKILLLITCKETSIVGLSSTNPNVCMKPTTNSS